MGDKRKDNPWLTPKVNEPTERPTDPPLPQGRPTLNTKCARARYTVVVTRTRPLPGDGTGARKVTHGDKSLVETRLRIVEERIPVHLHLPLRP